MTSLNVSLIGKNWKGFIFLLASFAEPGSWIKFSIRFYEFINYLNFTFRVLSVSVFRSYITNEMMNKHTSGLKQTVDKENNFTGNFL